MSKKERELEETLNRVMELVNKLEMAEPWALRLHGNPHRGRTVARAIADDIREAIADNPRKQGLHSLNKLELLDYSVKPKRLKRLIRHFNPGA